MLFIAILLVSCEDNVQPSEVDWPRVKTTSFTPVNNTSIRVEGTITQNSKGSQILEYGFLIGVGGLRPNLNNNQGIVIVESQNGKDFSGQLELPNTNPFSVFNVRAYIVTAEYTVLGNSITFKISNLD